MSSLVLKIKKTLVSHKMVEQGDCILLGVSGGPDSVALLRGMFELKNEMGIELAIAHLNHCARGEESDRDAQFVEKLGKELDVRTFIEKKDVAAHQVTTGRSFQETARNLRQEFFQRTMCQVGADKVALGHTADDQAETVIMNLLRGSGLKGMGGMSPVRHPYIRPMFYCSRSEVMEFLNDRKIDYRIDSSNEKIDYLRNRIRLELIPFLQENYNPKIAETLFESSEIVRVDNDYLKKLEDREFERVVLRFDKGETLKLNIENFALLPLALKRRLVRKGIQSVKGDLRKISFFHIQEVLQLFEPTQKGKRIDLPDNVQVLCLGDRVEFKRNFNADSSILNDDDITSDWMKSLNIPGETQVEKAGLTLRAKLIDPAETKFVSGQHNQAFLDFDKTGADIVIRFFQAGDRLVPLGMKGTKKLKSIFIDEKVPQENRSSVPILTTGENDIIWVYGTRIAQPYRVTPNTSKVLFIKGLT